MFRQLHMAAAGDLRLFALLLFFTMFLAVLVRFFVLRRRDDFNALERLPLQDDTCDREQAP
jgi:cbb3-type cytochrome oxidase subunit 3